MPALRIPFQTQLRAAAVELLTDYAADRDLKLQVYPARPRSIFPPAAFIDRMNERMDFLGPVQYRRNPTVEVMVIHGLFDHKDAVDQRDAFVDGFLDWCADRFHAAGENTLMGAVSIEDDPSFVPDWQPPDVQKTYFATRISLEGLALD